MRLEAMREAYRDRSATASITGVADALGKALDRTFNVESKLLEQMGGFLGVLEEASAKRAAQVLGARGGSRTQERRRRLPKPPSCRLCANPNVRDPTWAEVEEHRKHIPNASPASPANGNGES
jgi:hypothetical protein